MLRLFAFMAYTVQYQWAGSVGGTSYANVIHDWPTSHVLTSGFVRLYSDVGSPHSSGQYAYLMALSTDGRSIQLNRKRYTNRRSYIDKTLSQTDLDMINQWIAEEKFRGFSISGANNFGEVNTVTLEPAEVTFSEVDFPASPAELTASMGQVIAPNGGADALPAYASALMTEVSVSTTVGVIFGADPLVINADMREPAVKAQTIDTVRFLSPMVMQNGNVITAETVNTAVGKVYIKVPAVDAGKYVPVEDMRYYLKASSFGSGGTQGVWVSTRNEDGSFTRGAKLGSFYLSGNTTIPAGTQWIEVYQDTMQTQTYHLYNPSNDNILNVASAGFYAKVEFLDFIDISADAFEANAEMTEADVKVVSHALVAADPAGASASMPGGLPPHAYVNGSVMDATARMGEAWFKSNRRVTLDSAAEATGEAVEPAEVYAGREVLLEAATASASGFARDPELVNGQQVNNDLHDPYWNRVTGRATEGYNPPRPTGTQWFRFNERSGGKTYQTSVNTGLRGTITGYPLEGVFEQGVPGVYNRNALRVGDLSLQIRDSNSGVYNTSDTREAGWSMEFTLKVEPGHKGRMDIANGMERNGYSGARRYSHVSVRDGHIYASSFFGGTSIKAIDDGKWHHVVITVEPRPPLMAEFIDPRDLLIYIDGKLDRTLASEENSGAGAFDAGRGASPQYLFGGDTGYPFKGEFMEFIWRPMYMRSEQVMDLYLDLHGYKAVRATVTDGTGDMTQKNRVVSNMKRMLVLTFNEKPLRRDWSGNTESIDRGLDVARFSNEHEMDVRDLSTGIPTLSPMLGYGYDEEMDIGRYQVNMQKVNYADIYTLPEVQAKHGGSPLKDEVTGKPRFVNLQKDFDLDQFDVIAFQGYPNPSYKDQDERQKYEDFFDSVNQALVDGHKLWVSDGYLAADLGWVSRVEVVPVLRLWGNDIKGFEVAPWIGNNGKPVDLPADGSMFIPDEGYPQGIQNSKENLWKWDIHHNNGYRVVNEIEGLTTLPTWEVKENFLRQRRTMLPTQEQWYQRGFMLENRTGETWESESAFDNEDGSTTPVRTKESTGTGLKAGDEFYDYKWFRTGFQMYYHWGGASSLTGLHNAYRERALRTWAVPAGHLKIGTPVATFRTTLENDYGKTIPNPYRNHIRNAVVRPGDRLPDGRKVNGYVYMDFAEHPDFDAIAGEGIRVDEHYPVGMTPPSNSEHVFAETEYSHKWDWLDYGRTHYGGSGFIFLEGTTKIVMKYDKKTGITTGKIKAIPGFSVPIAEKRTKVYPTTPVPHITWNARGIAWLTLVEVEDAEYASTAADVATAQGAMLEATVVADNDMTVNAEPAKANADIVAPAETQVRDVKIVTYPATASGKMGGLQGGYIAEAATAYGDMPQNVRRPLDIREVLFFSLTYNTETIYLRMEDNG